jgi:hypothetical protein
MRRISPLVLASGLSGFVLAVVLAATSLLGCAAEAPGPATPAPVVTPPVTPPPAVAPAPTPAPVVATPVAPPSAVTPAPAPTAAAEPPAVLPVTPPTPGSVATTMAKNGNVRFGPSLSARVAVTLPAGAPVEILGIAQGRPDWFAVRFPRQGTAWAHKKVLEAQADGKTFKVIEDRAKARDDATLKGNIVCELTKGEIVESKERQIGDWQAIYPASGVAYVHKSLVTITEQLPASAPAGEALVEVTWQRAQKLYAEYQAALKQDLNLAATLDWRYLSDQLETVANEHPSVRAQLTARRMKEAIAKVVAAVEKVQRDNNITPVRPPEPTEMPPVTPKPALIAPKGTEAIQQVSAQAPQVPVDTAFQAKGWLEERAFPQVGTNHVIIDKDGNVCAFIKVKTGVELQLSEYFWRLVGVKGALLEVDPALHNLGRKIPLIEVEDVTLLGQ